MNAILLGDCREIMRKLIADGVKVQMCVTSPPYWGLRDYGVAGQLGLESTPQEYVANMVEVFRLVRELLADDGTLWLNLGDSYNSQGGHTQIEGDGRTNRAVRSAQKGANVAELKTKDLVGIPWRVAFALQADGWYLRQDIIWSKPNPMPELVRDRCTKAHEYLFLLSKRERYYYDADAIAEPVTGDPGASRNQWDTKNYEIPGQKPQKRTARAKVPSGWDTEHKSDPKKGRYDDRTGEPYEGVNKRNKRSVWTVATSPYSEAHFATFPPKLIEPCVLAGSRAGDIVFDPFFGSGTTGEVAQRLGRQWLGIELNPKYAKLAEARTSGTLGFAI